MVKDETELVRNGYSLVLLFSFLFGALMTLMYMETMKTLCQRPLSVMALLFAVSCVLASSLTGLSMLPMLTAVFGSAAAMELDTIKVLLTSGFDKILPEALILLLLTPSYFCIAFWGMNCSADIRRSMEQRSKNYGKYRFIPYAIMFIGAGSLYLLHRYIVNI